jgi:dTMP kinase
MTGGTDRWSARVEALLFAAARADHVERVIRPALERGDWVLCDRFIDSTRAYQGGAGGVSDDKILQLHGFGSDGLLPDRTLLLALMQGEAALRARTRDGVNSDRFGSKSADYHARLGLAFEAFAKADPHRFRRIDADGAVGDVTSRLLDALVDLL